VFSPCYFPLPTKETRFAFKCFRAIDRAIAGNDDAIMKEFYSFRTEVHRRNGSCEKEVDGDIGMPD
jgi:hypothetical protein